MKQVFNRKVAIVGLIAVAALVLVLSLAPGLAAEDLPSVGILEEGGDCIILDANGNETLVSNEAKIVGRNGRNRIVLLQCEDVVDPGDNGGAIKWTFENTGRFCAISDTDDIGSYGDVTTDWNIVISASGNTMLTCHFDDPPID